MTAAAASHCPYCALQCAMTLTPASAASPASSAPSASPAGASAPTAVPASAPAAAPAALATAVVSGRDFPTNRGGLCKKGWTSAELLDSAERVRQPLIRDRETDVFRGADWDEALDLIADTLRDSRARFGADSVGVFGGGGLTNEKAYQLGKFARLALGTSRIDYNGRFCMSSAAAAANRAFGIDRGLPFPVTDLDDADTVLILGSNVAETMPPFIGHLSGVRSRGGLIAVDPRRSATARLTEDGGGIHLQPTPGSDLVLLLGLTHIVIAENLVDDDYIATRTSGFDAVRRSTNQWWPERVQSRTGVPVAQLREVARRLANGRGSYILTGRGVEQHVDGTDTATAALNLALVLGLPGRVGSGYGTMTGQGNGQGGREHGQKCDQLPGYRKIVDPDARAHVAAAWGVDPALIPGPGVPAVELLAELGVPGKVRCLLVHGSNVVVSAPDVAAVRRGLEALDLLVVCDFFLSETARLADVVLPVTQWAEEEGTMTSLEGRILRRRAAIDPPPGVRSELWIMSELARRLDAPATWSTVPAEVFDELARASAGGLADYSGLSHRMLDDELMVDASAAPVDASSAPVDTSSAPVDTPAPADAVPGAYWPFPVGSTGTPRLFLDRFAHPDGLARLVAVSARVSDAEAAGTSAAATVGTQGTTAARTTRGRRGGTLTLITGRLLEHYQSGTQTRRVPELLDARPAARLQIHPATASRLGVVDGDEVTVSNSRGLVRVRAEVSTGIRLDTVFLPFHYAGDECANLLTEAAVDPISAMPEFKRTTVTVQKADARG